MVQECEYNPDKDLVPVSQYGYVDIVKANATSKVDSVDSLVEERFNDIDDPRSIGERPSDEFEMMQANKVVSSYVPPKEGASE